MLIEIGYAGPLVLFATAAALGFVVGVLARVS